MMSRRVSITRLHRLSRHLLICGLLLWPAVPSLHAAPPAAGNAEAAKVSNSPAKAAAEEAGKDNAEQKDAPANAAGNGPTANQPANGATNGTTEEQDTAAAEKAESDAAVALPVSPDPVRIYGWREHVRINGIKDNLLAKLDTGALTSSIHAEDKELFERDGKKWVRFIVTDPGDEKPVRHRIEAPLVRVARVKEPNSESVRREVVRLSFQIGERKMTTEFSLNNRSNMLAPVLLGRRTLKDLGWVDSGRTFLADQKIFR